MRNNRKATNLASKFNLATQRKKSDYNSKNTGHALVAAFGLDIPVKNPYILSRDPFMLKKY